MNKEKCSHCRLFYSTIDFPLSSDIKKSRLNIRKHKELAKNITQELYFLDFNGKTIDLNNNYVKRNLTEFDLNLQEKCKRHLEKIKKFSKDNVGNCMIFRKKNFYSKFYLIRKKISLK